MPSPDGIIIPYPEEYIGRLVQIFFPFSLLSIIQNQSIVQAMHVFVMYKTYSHY